MDSTAFIQVNDYIISESPLDDNYAIYKPLRSPPPKTAWSLIWLEIVNTELCVMAGLDSAKELANTISLNPFQRVSEDKCRICLWCLLRLGIRTEHSKWLDTVNAATGCWNCKTQDTNDTKNTEIWQQKLNDFCTKTQKKMQQEDSMFESTTTNKSYQMCQGEKERGMWMWNYRTAVTTI